MSKYKNSKVQEDGSLAKRIRLSKNNEKLFLICFERILCVDISECDACSYDVTALPPPLPVSFDLDIGRQIKGGWFLDNEEIAVMGGYETSLLMDMEHDPTDDPPLALLKLKTIPNSSSPVEVVATKSYRGTTLPKGGSLCIRIGRNVYVLGSMYYPDREISFNVIDIDTGSMNSLPEPPFLDNNSDPDLKLKVTGYYVVGSKFFLILTANANWRRCEVYCYDTEGVGSWAKVTQDVISWFHGGDYLSLLHEARCVKGFGLKKKVLLSYLDPGNPLDRQQYRPKLLAILITDMGRPLCYQEIFDEVHIVPSFGLSNSTAVSDLGNGLNCAFGTFFKDCGAFISICLFELVATSGAAVFDDLTEEELVGRDDLPREVGFLKVEVRKKFISGFEEYDDREFLDAFLL